MIFINQMVSLKGFQFFNGLEYQLPRASFGVAAYNEVMCEGCEATGRISPAHLQEYEIAISPVRDVIDLCEPPF